MKIDWNRLLSGLLALGYLCGAYFAWDAVTTLKVAGFLTLPLACIWYGDEMGSYVGVIRGQAITAQTPGCLVRFGGWLLMLLPLVIGAIVLIKEK
jgi:hypothetical protein